MKVFESLTSIAMKVFESLTSIAMKVFESLTSIAMKVFESLTSIAMKVFESLTSIAMKVFESLTSIAMKVFESLTSIAMKVFESLTSIAMKVFESLTSIAMKVFESLTSIAMKVFESLTSIAMKVFDRLLLRYLKTATDSLLDPHQFVYRANRPVEDSVCLRLHLVLKHLDHPNTYARILFIDNSLVLNTIIQHKHFVRLRLLNVNSQVYRWILDFFLNWTQVVKFNSKLSEPLTLSTGAPQGGGGGGGLLSSLLFRIFTNDCRSSQVLR